MIDCENAVFNTLATNLREEFPGIFVSQEYIDVPANFPAVTVHEINNAVNQYTRTFESIENHATISYEISVYSNKANGKRKEAKGIVSFVDHVMGRNDDGGMGFLRTFGNAVPNLNDATIFRYVLRYTGTIEQFSDNEFIVYH